MFFGYYDKSLATSRHFRMDYQKNGKIVCDTFRAVLYTSFLCTSCLSVKKWSFQNIVNLRCFSKKSTGIQNHEFPLHICQLSDFSVI